MVKAEEQVVAGTLHRLVVEVIDAGKKKLYEVKACKLKLGDLKGGFLYTESAMRDGDDNVKALFHQDQAYMALNEVDAAVKSIEKALKLEPNEGKTDIGILSNMLIEQSLIHE